MSSNIRAKILLVDDEADLLLTGKLLLQKTYDVLTADSVPAGKAVVRNNDVDVAIVDLNFEGQEADGLDFLDWISAEHSDIPVIVLSGDGNTERVAAAARRRHLVDFIAKTRDYENDLNAAIRAGLELRRQRTEHSVIFKSKSPQVQKVLESIEKIVRSKSDCSILITGETGTGKEVLVKHFAERLGKRLVTANMAAIPKEMAESLLFGHKKGSFTGAHVDMPGLILQAENGVFFLDELGECSLSVQAKLLRVIQEREVHQLGAPAPTLVKVRFIAATNRNLNEMVEQGEFREDLLQRINTISLNIPALRERPEDIELYATIFAQDASEPLSLRASGLEALLEYPWPGNVRELESVIARIAVLSDKREVDGDVVRAALGPVTEAMPVMERYNKMRSDILSALEKTQGNRTRAAAALKMHPTNLFKWIKKLGIGSTVAGKPGRPSLLPEGAI